MSSNVVRLIGRTGWSIGHTVYHTIPYILQKVFRYTILLFMTILIYHLPAFSRLLYYTIFHTIPILMLFYLINDYETRSLRGGGAPRGFTETHRSFARSRLSRQVSVASLAWLVLLLLLACSVNWSRCCSGHGWRTNTDEWTNKKQGTVRMDFLHLFVSNGHLLCKLYITLFFLPWDHIFCD